MKSKLKKIQMPQNEKFDLDELLSSEAPEGESKEAPEGEEGMEQEEAQSPGPLEQFSDDELMAEMKKRGLMSDLEQSNESESEPSEEQPDYGM